MHDPTKYEHLNQVAVNHLVWLKFWRMVGNYWLVARIKCCTSCDLSLCLTMHARQYTGTSLRTALFATPSWLHWPHQCSPNAVTIDYGLSKTNSAQLLTEKNENEW